MKNYVFCNRITVTAFEKKTVTEKIQLMLVVIDMYKDLNMKMSAKGIKHFLRFLSIFLTDDDDLWSFIFKSKIQNALTIVFFRK